MGQDDKRSSLPSIDHLLQCEPVPQWLEDYPRQVVVQALRRSVSDCRRALQDTTDTSLPTDRELVSTAERYLDAAVTLSLHHVINATGVVLHTGLGRAPLAPAAIDAVVEVARGYSNLELDLASGTRGRRVDHLADLLAEITGAEAATVVNNNAAATLLILNTVAAGREVIVSRGELVEIGGSYRLPEMMTASGARLREVGTTNRTRRRDYAAAITDLSAAVMRVHSSNFKIVGFTESVGIAELVEVAHQRNLLAIDDLGSGALFDLAPLGLPHEPDVAASIRAGADLVRFSGDKLLGGPQAGVILGRRDLIRRIEANPLMRTYRVDKMTLAALAATLQLYRDPAHAMAHVPSLRMLGSPGATLVQRAETLVQLLAETCPTEAFTMVSEHSVAGGGSVPGEELPTRCVAWTPSGGSTDTVLQRLRTGQPPVVARASGGRILLDLRTLADGELPGLAAALRAVVDSTA